MQNKIKQVNWVKTQVVNWKGSRNIKRSDNFIHQPQVKFRDSEPGVESVGKIESCKEGIYSFILLI